MAKLIGVFLCANFRCERVGLNICRGPHFEYPCWLVALGILWNWYVMEVNMGNILVFC
jgi:hypothetical protein